MCISGYNQPTNRAKNSLRKILIKMNFKYNFSLVLNLDKVYSHFAVVHSLHVMNYSISVVALTGHLCEEELIRID